MIETAKNSVKTSGNKSFCSDLLCDVVSLKDLNLGDKVILEFKHPYNLSGDFIWQIDYLVSKVESVFTEFTHCEMPWIKRKLMSIGNGLFQVSYKYSA